VGEADDAESAHVDHAGGETFLQDLHGRPRRGQQPGGDDGVIRPQCVDIDDADLADDAERHPVAEHGLQLKEDGSSGCDDRDVRQRQDLPQRK